MAEVGVTRPHEVALFNEINRVIDEIAPGNLTRAEIVGILNSIAMDVHLAGRFKGVIEK